jgi:chromosome segregation ATPase
MSTSAVTGSPSTTLLQNVAAATTTAATGTTPSQSDPPPAYLDLQFGQTLSALGVAPPTNVDDSDAVLATLSLQLDKLFAQSRDADAASLAARISAALTQLRAMAAAIESLNGDRAAAAAQQAQDQSEITTAQSGLNAARAALAKDQTDVDQAQKDLNAAITPDQIAAATAKLNAAKARVASDKDKIAQLTSQLRALQADEAKQAARVSSDTTQINATESLAAQISASVPKVDSASSTKQHDAEMAHSDATIVSTLSDVAKRSTLITTQAAQRQTNEQFQTDAATTQSVGTQISARENADSTNTDTTIVQTSGLVQTNRDPNQQTVRGLAQLLLRDKLEDFARSDSIPGAIATLLKEFAEVTGALSELSAEAPPASQENNADRVQIPG